MQQIGVGGTLSFNAGPALHGMQQATHGFEHLDRAREQFQHNLHSLGESFEHFNLIAAGLGVAGVAGIHALIHSSFEAASEMEQAQIAIGTNLGIARGKGFKHGLALAKQEIEKLQDIGVETGATQEGLFGIYKQLSLPLSQAGASMGQLRDFTKQTAVMAMATGNSFEEMGGDIQRFLAGFVRDRDPLFRQLKMSGLVRADMAAEELQTMTAQQRMKLVSQVLKRYTEGADIIGSSWTAVGNSIHNVINQIKESFIGSESGLFGTVKRDVRAVITYFQEHKEQIKSVAAELGAKLVPIYNILKAALTDILDRGIKLARFVGGLADDAGRLGAFFGITSDQMASIAKYAAEFAMVIGTVIPLLSVFSTIMGPGAALIRTVVSGIGYLLTGLAAFAWPLIGIIATLAVVFMALRKDGEGFGETMVRIWTDYIKPAWEGFIGRVKEILPYIIEPLKAGFDAIKEAVLFLMDYLSDTFITGADSAKDFGITLGTVVSFIGNILSYVIGMFAKLLAGAIYSISWIIYGFKTMAKWVADGVRMSVVAVTNVFKGLVEIFLLPFRAILAAIGESIAAVANTTVGKAAFKLAGIDAKDAVAMAERIKGIVDATQMKYDEVPSFSKAGETPDEEVLRKREGRLNKPKINVTVESKHEINVKHQTIVDGKVLAQAQSAHQVEISERAGAKTSPWQRRSALIRQQGIPAAGAK